MIYTNYLICANTVYFDMNDFYDDFKIEAEMINTAKNYNGYFKFDSAIFNYLSSSICYFVENEYDSNNAFAVKRIDENTSYIYKELKTNTCNIVPVIEVDKVLLTN